MWIERVNRSIYLNEGGLNYRKKPWQASGSGILEIWNIGKGVHLRGEAQPVAKLGDLSYATLHLACLPGWLDMRVTSEQHVPEKLHVPAKFSMWLSWETPRGHQCRARHISKFSQALSKTWNTLTMDSVEIGRVVHCSAQSKRRKEALYTLLCPLPERSERNLRLTCEWSSANKITP